MRGWEEANNSPLNLLDEVKEGLYLPDKVCLHDTTLRDGEQFPGVEFTKDEKIEIARALSDYGVHRIEIMPAVSTEDLEATRDLNSMELSAEIVGFCRSREDDVQKAIEAGCRAIVMEIITCPPLLKGVGWSFEEAIDKFINASHFAKNKGLRVTGFFVAVTDAPLDFSRKFIQKIIKETDVDSYCIPDSFSKCLPQALYHYVRMIKGWTDKPIEIHSHNAFNMGVANALAGVMAGAEVVHTCVNGLGEGAGNASLDAVAMNLQMMLGVETGIQFEKTYELCKLVAKLSRINLQANWPLVGERVFTMESGIAVDLITKMVEAGEGLPPDKDIAAILGRKRYIVVGKMSGRTSIKVKMKQLGLPLPEEDDLNQILSRVKERSIAIHDSLSDDEFKNIVSEVVNYEGGKEE